MNVSGEHGDVGDLGTIRGTVLNEEHQPISNATVLLPAFRVELLTNVDGSFEFRSVPMGRQVVEAHASGHRSASLATEVKPAEASELDFVLPMLPVQIPHYVSQQKVAKINHGVGAYLNQCTGCNLAIEFPVDPDYLLVEIEGKHAISNPARPDGISFEIRKITGVGASSQNGSQLATCRPASGTDYANWVNNYNACSTLPVRIFFDAQKLNSTWPGGRNTRGVAVALACDAYWHCLEESYTVYVTSFYFWAPAEVPTSYRASNAPRGDCLGDVCSKAQPSPRDERAPRNEVPPRGQAQVIHLLQVPAPHVQETPWLLWSLAIALLLALAYLGFLVSRRGSEDRIRDLLSQASAAFQAGDDPKTKRLARRLLKMDPRHGDAWFLYGAALLANGQNEQAIEELEAAMAKFGPQLSGLAYVLSLAHERAGHPEAARNWLPLVAKDSEFWQSLGQNTDFKIIRAQANRLRNKRQAPPIDPSYA